MSLKLVAFTQTWSVTYQNQLHKVTALISFDCGSHSISELYIWIFRYLVELTWHQKLQTRTEN